MFVSHMLLKPVPLLAPFESVRASTTMSWLLTRKRLIFLDAGSGAPVPSVLGGVLVFKE